MEDTVNQASADSAVLMKADNQKHTVIMEARVWNFHNYDVMKLISTPAASQQLMAGC